MSKTELFVRQDPGGFFAVVDESVVTGNIFWVDSGQTTTGADSVGYGLSPDKPFVTLDYAFSSDVCTANNGDIIYLMPGHAENVISAGDIAQDIAGVRVIGLGQGADRPTFTFTTADTATWTVSAASSWIENVILLSALNAVANNLSITAADCTLKDVEIQDGSATVEFAGSILTSAAADRLLIDGLVYRGFTAGDACTRVIQVVGTNDTTVRNSSFYGEVSTAIVDITTAAVNLLVEHCTFYNDSVALTKNVVDTATGSTWLVRDCFDGKGGYGFSGSSTLPLAADDISAVTSFATTSSTAVSGLTSSAITSSTAVSGLTSSAITSSTAISGLTSSAVTSSTVVSGLTSSAITSSTAVSGLTSSAITSSTAVSGLTSSAVVASTAVAAVSTSVSGLTSSAITSSTAVSGLTSSAITSSTAVSGLTSSAITSSTAVSGLTSSAVVASTAVSGITSYLVTILSYVLSGW